MRAWGRSQNHSSNLSKTPQSARNEPAEFLKDWEIRSEFGSVFSCVLSLMPELIAASAALLGLMINLKLYHVQ